MRVTVAVALALTVAILTPPLLATQGPIGSVPVVAATGNKTKAHAKEITASALSADGRLFASGSEDNTIKLWSIPSGDLVRTISAHKKSISRLAFTPDGRLLAASAWDKTVSLSSTEDGRQVASLTGHSGGVDSILLSPDGTVLISTGGKDLKAWSVSEGKLLATMPSETLSAKDAVFLPDGKMFAFFTRAGLQFVSVPDLRAAGSLDCPSAGRVRPNPVITSDGTRLVVVCNGNLTVWSTADRRLLTTIPGAPFNKSLQLSSDGTMVATGDADGVVRLWNLTEGRAGAVLQGHSGPVASLAFTPDGSKLASGSWDGTVRLWSVAEGTGLAVLEGQRGSIDHLYITPDGSTVVTGLGWTLEFTGSNGRSIGMRKVTTEPLIALWDISPPRFREFLGR